MLKAYSKECYERGNVKRIQACIELQYYMENELQIYTWILYTYTYIKVIYHVRPILTTRYFFMPWMDTSITDDEFCSKKDATTVNTHVVDRRV